LPTDPQSPERQISRGVVAIYKDYTGRGPTSAQTKITDLCSTTLLRDALTKAERKLVQEGDTEMVRTIRRRFQDVMCDDICALVEQVTLRETDTFLSDHHSANDVAVEMVTFVKPPPASE
jgi:uncharacterized protein YbcI